MCWIIFFLAMAICLIVVIFIRNSKLPKGSKRDRNELHVLNLEKGGVFKVTGFVPESETLELTVLDKHLYKAGDFSWFELECDKGTGEKIWAEVEDDDEIIVSIVLEKLGLEAVPELTPQRLKKIDDDESGSVTYGSRKFFYQDSDSAVFYKRCERANAEKLYYWDFKSTDMGVTYSLSVEKWGNNEFQVFCSQQMKPQQITVYKNSSEN